MLQHIIPYKVIFISVKFQSTKSSCCCMIFFHFLFPQIPSKWPLVCNTPSSPLDWTGVDPLRQEVPFQQLWTYFHPHICDDSNAWKIWSIIWFNFWHSIDPVSGSCFTIIQWRSFSIETQTCAPRFELQLLLISKSNMCRSIELFRRGAQ